MTDIITGPGLYVLRNGNMEAINHERESRWWNGTARSWSKRGHFSRTRQASLFDIIRRATPEEAAKFCGLIFESK